MYYPRFNALREARSSWSECDGDRPTGYHHHKASATSGSTTSHMGLPLRIVKLDNCIVMCPVAVQAHKTFKALRWVAAGAGLLAALCAAFGLGSGGGVKRLLAPVIAAALSAALAWKSHTLKGQFEFQDYRWPSNRLCTMSLLT